MTELRPTPEVDPLVGRVIQERFRVDAKLGQGGMGAVYLAEHLRLKKMVALKCLHPELASDPDVVRRFKNEAVAASSIGHPNIVDIMDMGTFDDGTFFMVLEFLEGRDLQSEIDESGPQPVEHVAHVGIQICLALAAASAKGIVHRDLKPENVFLTQRPGDDAYVKVLDFGISKIIDGKTSATKTGEVLGTPYYMAPEQVLGEKDITHLADVFALGVIFFQALSGTMPFEGETLPELIVQIATQPAPSLAERCPDLPVELIRLVDQMLEKEPASRPQTFVEISQRLAPFLSETSRLYRTEAVATSRTIVAGAAPAPARLREMGARVASVTETHSFRKSVPWAAALVVGLGVWLLWGGEDAESLRLSVTTIPADASLTVNGKPVDNPYEGTFASSEERHEIVAERAGFEAEKRQIVLERDEKLVLTLEKAPPAEDHRAPKSSSPSPSPSSSPSPSPSPSSSPSPSPSPSPSSSPSPSPSPRPASGSSSDSTPKPLKKLERGLRKLF